jgi:hypothetical protein
MGEENYHHTSAICTCLLSTLDALGESFDASLFPFIHITSLSQQYPCLEATVTQLTFLNSRFY